MRKGFLFSTIITVTLLAYNMVMGEEVIRVGVVDLQRCLQESKEGQKVTRILKKKKEVLQRQLDTRQKELFDLRKDLEKQAMMLSMNAQQDKRRTIERKTRELEYFFKDLNEDMIRAQEKEKQRILNALGKIIEKIGSEEDFILIMEKRAGGVLYRAESLDITERVIRAYDQVKKEGKE
jgi:outer membrane protein